MKPKRNRRERTYVDITCIHASYRINVRKILFDKDDDEYEKETDIEKKGHSTSGT